MHLLFACLLQFNAAAESLAVTESERPPTRSAPACLRADNINGDDPESSLRQLMQNLSDEEVFARLVYAETLASNCPSPALARGIGWAIRNRMEARNERQFGIGREVVFKRAQFRSSTGSCDVAQRAAFLCPTGNPNYENIWNSSVLIERESKSTTAPSQLRGVKNYFFKRHFEISQNCSRWKNVTPDWVKKSDNIALPGVDAACVGFYKL